MTENCPNLVGLVNRMKERCFPDWEEICTTLDLNSHLPKPAPEETKEKEGGKDEKEGDKENEPEDKDIEKEKVRVAVGKLGACLFLLSLGELVCKMSRHFLGGGEGEGQNQREGDRREQGERC